MREPETSRIFRNLLETSGNFWKLLESSGIFWKLLESSPRKIFTIKSMKIFIQVISHRKTPDFFYSVVFISYTKRLNHFLFLAVMSSTT